jgi:LacI family transcriptional regulator
VQATGNNVPTIYDVASRAGVSIATVSRVLNGRSNGSTASYAQVMEAVEVLGFVPNGSARGLSKGLKRVIGIVYGGGPATDELLAIEEESLLFTDSVVRGAEAGAQKQGYSLLLSGAPAGAVGALTGKVDGLVLLDQVLPERRVAPLAKRVPVVLLAGSGRSRAAVTVRVDNEVAMAGVVEHLVGRHGRRRLAFVSGLDASPDSVTRARSFLAGAVAAGASVEPLADWAADWTSAGAVEVARARLQSGAPLPEAIACANDQMAIGIVHALGRAGVRIPNDIAVVGFDDIPVSRHLSPPLTTVRQPSRQLGATAVEVLIDMVEGRPPARRDIVLPTELQVRASCGCRPEGAAPVDSWQIAL